MAKLEAYTDAIYDVIEFDGDLKSSRSFIIEKAAKLGIRHDLVEYQNHYESSYNEFEAWLSDLLQQKKPPADLEALCFSLYETAETVTMFIAGAEEWDEEGDWALAKDYAPLSIEPYFPVFKEIYPLLEENLPAGLFLGTSTIIAFAKEFAAHHQDLFPEGVILGAGYDGGDVFDFMEV
ncbi:hypothetical protein GKZ89_13305 [Bacillus mangrovi]|uniref:Uncharacterized protein n=1 Tax=Metabacillus mangrovi TaxID=1491830 RepID=A0A7X2S7S0_9BACI|nr:hypothetical protein [Metabacillus mangrovi]MTH54381.1 hypothetical protein [Metabacillus mangrovi]